MVGSVEPDHLEGKGLCPIIGRIRNRLKPMVLSISAYMMLRPLPPSISTLVSRFVPTIGLTISGYLPSYGTLSGWSVRSKVMADSDHRRKVGAAGSAV